MAQRGTDIQHAARILERGGLVAIPTETVYGLAANALDTKAVASIFEAKHRPTFDPLIVHCDSASSVLAFVTDFPPQARTLAGRFWPGPLTLILPRNERIPDLVTAGLPTAGFRVPAHPLTRALLERLPFPLAAPSANPFGYVSPTCAQHVEDQLGHSVEYILDGGPCQIGVESTIVWVKDSGVEILRQGGVTEEQIREICKDVTIRSESSRPMAPGMLESHYAPRKKVFMGNIPQLLEHYSIRSSLVLSFCKHHHPNPEMERILSPSGDLKEAAGNLFRMVRELDQLSGEFLLVETVPDLGLGRAINDRLRRMSA